MVFIRILVVHLLVLSLHQIVQATKFEEAGKDSGDNNTNIEQTTNLDQNKPITGVEEQYQEFSLGKPLHITFVRHGETISNKNRIIQGQSNSQLSPEGIRQAELLGHQMSHHAFTRVYSSDLDRTRKTTELILGQSTNSKSIHIIEDVNLRERGQGIFEGRPKKERDEAAAQKGLTSDEFTSPGGETPEQLENRIISFLDGIFRLVDDENHSSQSEDILVVTHGGWLKKMFKVLNSNPRNFTLTNFKDPGNRSSPNTGVTKFDLYPVSEKLLPRLIYFNSIYDISHLNQDVSGGTILKNRHLNIQIIMATFIFSLHFIV